MHTRREFLKILLAIPFLPTFVRRFTEAPATPLFDAYVAGYRFYEGDDVIEDLRVGASLELCREPSNPYDANAIEIFADDEVKLGYVPMALNTHPASLMDAGEHVIAEVVELDPEAAPWERVRIVVKACA
jgi:hypothetical protein